MREQKPPLERATQHNGTGGRTVTKERQMRIVPLGSRPARYKYGGRESEVLEKDISEVNMIKR